MRWSFQPCLSSRKGIGYWADRVQQPGPSSDAVEQILGRPALTFAQWLQPSPLQGEGFSLC
ncbi:hypothetical protein [Ktedonobacter robiniae]|uniref:hypothetical protein n=1 Tax=Ktedonobacter robiniae TaxID=2778365 RepID=UPI001914F0D3|nr:hypothetical protein [Ktedonobacter robiniae]